MNNNILTACLATLMVMLSVGVLVISMTMYEKAHFDVSWNATPAVIEREEELKPLYSEDVSASSEY